MPYAMYIKKIHKFKSLEKKIFLKILQLLLKYINWRINNVQVHCMQICHITMNTMNQYPEVWLTHRPIDTQDIKNMYKSPIYLVSLLVDLDFSTFHMWHKYRDKNKNKCVHLPHTQYNKHFHFTCYIIISKNMIHWKITVT